MNNKTPSNLLESFIVDDDYYEYEENNTKKNEFDLNNSSRARSPSSESDYYKMNNLNSTISLNDLYETISLYEYENQPDNSKRITWEEWYLKKKIEGLKNDKKMKEKMVKKWEESKRNKRVYTEEEKNAFLMKWIDKKKQKRLEYEAQLEKLQQENEEKKLKKQLDKQKSEEKYQKWLMELKEKEEAEKQRKKQLEEKIRLNQERIKQTRAERNVKLSELNKGKTTSRPIVARKGAAIINGKIYNYFDWSTSPAPSYFNQNEWQS